MVVSSLTTPPTTNRENNTLADLAVISRSNRDVLIVHTCFGMFESEKCKFKGRHKMTGLPKNTASMMKRTVYELN